MPAIKAAGRAQEGAAAGRQRRQAWCSRRLARQAARLGRPFTAGGRLQARQPAGAACGATGPAAGAAQLADRAACRCTAVYPGQDGLRQTGCFCLWLVAAPARCGCLCGQGCPHGVPTVQLWGLAVDVLLLPSRICRLSFFELSDACRAPRREGVQRCAARSLLVPRPALRCCRTRRRLRWGLLGWLWHCWACWASSTCAWPPCGAGTGSCRLLWPCASQLTAR